MSMKANNGSGNIEERDGWETPKWLFDTLKKQYPFIFDCCANRLNRKTNLFPKDFLDWNNKRDYLSWMNPPFSKAEEMFKHFFTMVRKGVAIYRCDNFETKIWQEVIFPNVSWVFIPNKRIAYEGMKVNGSRFPSALIGIGVEPPKTLGGITLKPLTGEHNRD